MSEDQYLFFLTTVQTNAFKNLIEALNSILIDCNFEFIPDTEDQDGSVKILAVNNQISMLVHLRLFSKNFDVFQCKKKQVIGINMQNFYKIIKPITNSDIMSIYRYSCDSKKNRLCINISNKEKKQEFDYSIQIIDIDNDVLDISKVTFEAIVVMNSNDFQKICKDMNGLDAKYVSISLINKTFKIECSGDIGIGSASFNENDSGNIFINRQKGFENVDIRGRYDLKNLLLFTKCTNLCNSIEIYMKNDYPLLIKYTIASLGYMHLCLSPLIDSNDFDL